MYRIPGLPDAGLTEERNMTTSDHLAVSEELATTIGDLYDKYNPADAEQTEETEAVEDAAPEAEADNTTEDSHPEEDAEETVVEDATDEPSETEEVVETEPAETEDASGDGVTDEQVETYTVKVNGTEHQVELDELVRGYQTMRAANEKFEAVSGREKELNEYVEFAKGFTDAIQNDPAGLFAEYVEVVADPNTVIVKMIERASALGKLHPDLAEALGITDTDKLQAQAEYERARREKLEQQISQKTEEQADQFGYKPSDYNRIAEELVQAAGLDTADIEVQKQFVAELADFRAAKNNANPYLAFAEMQKTRTVDEATAKAAAAAVAVKQAVKTKRIPGSATSAGQVPPPPPAPSGPIYDHTEAARRAVEELMGE